MAGEVEELRERIAALERRLERQAVKREQQAVSSSHSDMVLRYALAAYVHDLNQVIRARRAAGNPVTVDEVRQTMGAAGIHVCF